MSRIRPEPGTKYVLENHVYVIRQLLLDGRFLVENLSLGGEQTLSEGELLRSLFDGRLKFVLPPAARKAEGRESLATAFEFGEFEDLPEHYRKEADRRLRWIAPLLKDLPRLPGRERIEQYRTALERGPTAEPLPSVSSLRRWVRAYAAAGSDVRALVPATYRSGGKGKQLEPEVSAAIDAVFAECRHDRKRRTAQDVYLKVVHRVAEENKSRANASPLTLPSKETIYRRLRATDATQILHRRPGRLQAKAKGSVFPGPEVERILERVEIDDTLLDLFVVDEEDRMPIGRPTLAVAIDVFSAYPVGFYVGFEPPGYRSVMNCLLHSILPKVDTRQTFRTVNLWLAYGLPERLVMDHGPGYISTHLKMACHQLGIEPYHAPKRTPWFKGAIERFYADLAVMPSSTAEPTARH